MNNVLYGPALLFEEFGITTIANTPFITGGSTETSAVSSRLVSENGNEWLKLNPDEFLVRVGICPASAGILSIKIYDGVHTSTELLNNGNALVAGAFFSQDIVVRGGVNSFINFQFNVDNLVINRITVIAVRKESA